MRGDLEICTMEPRKIKMVLHDDLIYQILLWLPVISLLRFKNACRSWRALIESSNFIKQHQHHHHYDPRLKDKNHNLICPLPGNSPPVTFSLTSVESFEESNVCLQPNCSDSDLHEYSNGEVLDIVSYNGIVCLNLLNRKRNKHSICLWNPATKQSRVLPQSPALRPGSKYVFFLTTVGFGVDVKNNDYKVVNLCDNNHPDEKRVGVYGLNTDSWRSITIVSPYCFFENPGMPFNNGTCFFWNVLISRRPRILCFDFSSENFHYISFPDADYSESSLCGSVINDKIACVFCTVDHQIEIHMFNDYGSINESWVKLYTIDPSSTINRRLSVKWLSMNGNYILFRGAMGPLIRYNVVTKEIKYLPTLEKDKDTPKNWGSPNYYRRWVLVKFKESLLSVEKGYNN